MSKKLFAVFGGTFDPPHNGHVNLAKAVLDQLHPDKLIIVPTSVHPYKINDGSDVCSEMRLQLADRAFSDLHDTAICDAEISGKVSGYTADTIRYLMREEPDARFILVLGADKLSGITEWYDADWLLHHVDLAVLSRGEENNDFSPISEELRKTYKTEITWLDALPLDISSTSLRKMLQEGKGSDFMPNEVFRFILRERLYSALPDADWLRAHALTGLGQHRLVHTLGCEYEAVRLANRWGTDEQDARIAAILHDCTKALDYDGQLKICQEYGITVDSAVLEQPKLLHAVTGAAVAKREYAVNEAVYQAIRWHTTGKPDMSVLEKVMYLADFIEPSRDFEGVDQVRELAYKDINKAMIRALSISLDEVRSNGTVPHTDSVDALDFLVAHR